MATKAKEAAAPVAIKAPDIRTVAFNIRGTAPYVQARFSGKAMQAMKSKMEAGSVARGKKVRETRVDDLGHGHGDRCVYCAGLGYVWIEADHAQ